MAIFQQCPECKTIQKLSNKKCCHKNAYDIQCGADLDKAKKNARVKYYIYYRDNGKQKKKLSGFSIETAKAEDGKIKAKKKENRLNEILDVLKDDKKNFQDLTDWYLELPSVKKLASHDRVKQALNAFNNVFGDKKILDVKQVDLESYQDKREAQKKSYATIDMEIKIAKAMVTKAFDNDEVDGRALKPFRKIKLKLKAGENARKSLVSFEQYKKLLENASNHYKWVLIIAFNTGMRLGEIKSLKWSYIDFDAQMIRLPKDITKEDKTKDIPINHHVKKILKDIPKFDGHDYIITYLGKPMTGQSSLKKQFPETCSRAGITHGRNTENGITFHDIRRTVKTNMVKAGIDKVYRDTILGHSLKGMDTYYIVPTDEALIGSMNAYTEWMDNEFSKAT